MSTILSLRDVHRVYKTASGDVAALRGVSCDFEEGLFHAIIGRSGSGKSTLLHVLGGLDRPTSGQVLMMEKDLYAMNDEQMAVFRRRHMGFVFQQFNRHGDPQSRDSRQGGSHYLYPGWRDPVALSRSRCL